MCECCIARQHLFDPRDISFYHTFCLVCFEQICEVCSAKVYFNNQLFLHFCSFCQYQFRADFEFHPPG